MGSTAVKGEARASWGLRMGQLWQGREGGGEQGKAQLAGGSGPPDTPGWAGGGAGLVLETHRPKVGSRSGPPGERQGPPPGGQEFSGASGEQGWALGAGVQSLGEQGLETCPLPPSQPPLWPGWQGLGAPSSLELARIKGWKAVLHPRPLRQEFVAPGDGIHSHIPGALVATRQGWGRAGVPRLAPGSVGTPPLPAPGQAAPSAGLGSGPLRGQSGVQGARQWVGPGSLLLTAGSLSPPRGGAEPAPSGQTAASEGRGYWWAALVGVTLRDRILAHSDVLTHVRTQPAATCSLAGRRPRLSWLQPQKHPGRGCSLLAGAELNCPADPHPMGTRPGLLRSRPSEAPVLGEWGVEPCSRGGGRRPAWHGLEARAQCSD